MARTRRRRAGSVSEHPSEAPLDAARIVTAALALLDEVGLASLTMRRLAERLGIQAATLYWYVRDKHELLSLLAEAICAEMRPPDPNAPWRARIEALGWEYRRVLLAHRDAAHILAATLPAGPHRLRLVDLALGTVLAAGFEGLAAARCGRLLVDFVTGFVQEEYVAAAHPAPAAPGRDPHDGAPFAFPAVAALPGQAEVYPNIEALSPFLTDNDGDARFSFAMGVILDGLEQYVSRR